MVLILYAMFILYLILELQRALRKKIRKNQKKQSAAEGFLVEWYVAEMEKIFLIGRVKGDFSDPTALYDKIKEGFPGIRPEEYFRACELIQKYRFGGIKLQAHELRVLKGITEKFEKCLYQKQHFPGKLKLRYIYAR